MGGLVFLEDCEERKYCQGMYGHFIFSLIFVQPRIVSIIV